MTKRQELSILFARIIAPEKYKIQQKFCKRFKLWTFSDATDEQLQEVINYIKNLK